MLGYCRYLLFLIILYLDFSSMSSKNLKFKLVFRFEPVMRLWML